MILFLFANKASHLWPLTSSAIPYMMQFILQMISNPPQKRKKTKDKKVKGKLIY